MNSKKLRHDARAIFDAGIKAADASAAIRRHLRLEGDTLIAAKSSKETWTFDIRKFKSIYVVGAGKAGRAMAQGVWQVLGSRITGGIVNVKKGQPIEPLPGFLFNPSGHPIPDEDGFSGAQRIAELLGSIGQDALIICLISGGASALLPFPAPPISLDEKKIVNKVLIDCGASIHEINTIRKHISAMKGGQFVTLAKSKPTIITLILSDVIGDDLDVIGSGPTVADSSKFDDAKEIAQQYGIYEQFPDAVRQRIEDGIAGKILQNPAHKDIFSHTRNILIGNNMLALAAAKKRATELGFRSMILSSCVQGETREVARVHAAIAKDLMLRGLPLRPPACIISGGETVVTLPKEHDGEKNRGGRNQEFILAAAIDTAGLTGVVILSGGTDGTDGPTPAAGAICDGSTVSRGLNNKNERLVAKHFLTRHDSFNFFAPLQDLVYTGDTNTNVMDLRVVLVSSSAQYKL